MIVNRIFSQIHPLSTGTFRQCLVGSKTNIKIDMIDATVYFLQRCIEEERLYKPILMNKEDIIVILNKKKK